MMRALTLPITLLLALSSTGLGQEAPAPATDPVTARDLPPVEEPPELSSVDRRQLARELDKLRNSHAGRRAETEQAVLAFGRGALPHLLDAASTDHEGKQAGLLRCLVELADARDRELVSRELESELVVLRRFAVVEAGELGLDTLLARLPDRLADPDTQVRREAAVALARNGREDGLHVLLEAWVAEAVEPSEAAWRARIGEALAGLRGQGTHSALRIALRVDPERDQDDPKGAAAERRAAVAMLHALGDDTARRALAKALDDPHNLVQRDAIDALRDLLEGGAPFTGGSIFAQIHEVERLKALLAGRR